MNKIIRIITFFCLMPLLVHSASPTTVRYAQQVGDEVVHSPKKGSSMYVKVTEENRPGFQIIGDYNCATRSPVYIKAVKRGTWQYGITHSDGTAYVYVWNVVDVVDISIPNALTLESGGSYKFVPVITDSSAKTTLTWESSNSFVATVDNNGTLMAINPGTATITVKASNGIQATCSVMVKSILAQSVMIDAVPDLTIGESYNLKYHILPDNTTNKNVIFQSSNPNVLDVSQTGEVIAISEGTAFVNIRTTDSSNVSGSVKVTVKSSAAPNCVITFNITDYGLFTLNTEPGNTLTIDYSPYSSIWKVVSFSFNGEILDPIETGKYITPIIDKSASIDIKITTTLPIIGELSNISNIVFNENVCFELDEGTVKISGLKDMDIVDVYLMNGMKVYSNQLSTDGELSISLPKNTYIIVLNNSTIYKVRI